MSHVTTLLHGFTQQSGLNKLPKCTYHLLYSEQGAKYSFTGQNIQHMELLD